MRSIDETPSVLLYSVLFASLWLNELVNNNQDVRDIASRYHGHHFGSEITSQVTEKCFDYLKRAPKRIGLPDHPTPSSRGYIDGYYPDSLKIIKIIIENLDLSEEKKSEIFDDLNNNKKELPIDIPDPAFQGPF